MKLSFDLTLEDLLAYHDYVYKHKLHKNRSTIIWGLYGTFILYFIYAQLNHSPDPGRYVVLGIVTVIFYLSLTLPLSRARNGIIDAVNENPAVIGNRVIDIQKNELSLSSSSISGRYKAKDITGIEETKTHIFLFNGEASSIIIPKSSFAAERDISTLKQWVNQG